MNQELPSLDHGPACARHRDQESTAERGKDEHVWVNSPQGLGDMEGNDGVPTSAIHDDTGLGYTSDLLVKLGDVFGGD
jgi:hypothetical protein